MLNSVGLFVTLIDSCNLDCKFCEFPNKPEFRTGKTLDYCKFMEILNHIKKEPPSIPLGAVCFCGSGEPLLYDKIIEIVKETKKIVPEVSIVTNGVLLNEKICEGLLSANINHIVVSITGNSTDTYSHFQGSGEKTANPEKQFETVCQNTERLVKMRDVMRADTKVGISYILNEISKGDYFKALSYWREVGADYVDTRILSTGFGLNRNDYKEYVVNNANNWQGGNCCTCFGKVMNVFTDGRIGFCNCAYRDETILGNLFEESLKEILDKPKFKTLLKSFEEDYDSIPNMCKSCELLRSRPILA